MGAAVLVGTQKGLFVLTSDETRRDWWVEGPRLTGFEVLHVMRDPQLRPLLNVYVNRTQVDGVEGAVEPDEEIRLVAAVAGG